MPKPKPLTKEQIVAAQANTKSNMAAARHLHVSYQHYKRYAKLYGLFEQHKNQSGKGIPKFLKGSGKEPALLDIIEGRVSASHFTPAKFESINGISLSFFERVNFLIGHFIPIKLSKGFIPLSYLVL